MNESLVSPKFTQFEIFHCKNHQFYSYQDYSVDTQTEEIVNRCQIISRSLKKKSRQNDFFDLSRKFFCDLPL